MPGCRRFRTLTRSLRRRPKCHLTLATVSPSNRNHYLLGIWAGKEDEMADERVRGIQLHGEEPKRLALSDGSRLSLDCEAGDGRIGWRRIGWRREGRHGGVTN